jgi:dipeptidyl aminopeptidase/acylaminoacyl peptidase
MARFIGSSSPGGSLLVKTSGSRVMAEKKGGDWRMFVAVGLVATLVYGCAGQEAVNDDVNAGCSLVSEEGRIAFTHAA